jgi:hypothetical protein
MEKNCAGLASAIGAGLPLWHHSVAAVGGTLIEGTDLYPEKWVSGLNQ